MNKVSTKLLINSLKVLSLPYREQSRSLPEYAIIKDDIISDFISAFYTLPILIEQDALSKNAVIQILECFIKVDMLLENSETSSEESFKNDDRWNQVRELAMNALSTLEEC